MIIINTGFASTLFAISALTLLVGWQEGHPACKKTKWWGACVVICLERGADLHTAQLMPLLLTVSCFSKIKMVLPFWYRLTRVVQDKGPLNVFYVVFLPARRHASAVLAVHSCLSVRLSQVGARAYSKEFFGVHNFKISCMM